MGVSSMQPSRAGNSKAWHLIFIVGLLLVNSVEAMQRFMFEKGRSISPSKSRTPRPRKRRKPPAQSTRRSSQGPRQIRRTLDKNAPHRLPPRSKSKASSVADITKTNRASGTRRVTFNRSTAKPPVSGRRKSAFPSRRASGTAVRPPRPAARTPRSASRIRRGGIGRSRSCATVPSKTFSIFDRFARKPFPALGKPKVGQCTGKPARRSSAHNILRKSSRSSSRQGARRGSYRGTPVKRLNDSKTPRASSAAPRIVPSGRRFVKRRSCPKVVPPPAPRFSLKGLCAPQRPPADRSGTAGAIKHVSRIPGMQPVSRIGSPVHVSAPAPAPVQQDKMVLDGASSKDSSQKPRRRSKTIEQPIHYREAVNRLCSNFDAQKDIPFDENLPSSGSDQSQSEDEKAEAIPCTPNSEQEFSQIVDEDDDLGYSTPQTFSAEAEESEFERFRDYDKFVEYTFEAYKELAGTECNKIYVEFVTPFSFIKQGPDRENEKYHFWCLEKMVDGSWNVSTIVNRNEGLELMEDPKTTFVLNLSNKKMLKIFKTKLSVHRGAAKDRFHIVEWNRDCGFYTRLLIDEDGYFEDVRHLDRLEIPPEFIAFPMENPCEMYRRCDPKYKHGLEPIFEDPPEE